MPLARFASIEQRINAAVTRHLANAEAVYQGGEPFGVQFERESATPVGGAVDTVQAVASFESQYAPGLTRGSVLVINEVSYTVDTAAEPDASGWLAVGLYQTPVAPQN